MVAVAIAPRATQGSKSGVPDAFGRMLVEDEEAVPTRLLRLDSQLGQRARVGIVTEVRDVHTKTQRQLSALFLESFDSAGSHYTPAAVKTLPYPSEGSLRTWHAGEYGVAAAPTRLGQRQPT